VHVSLVNDAASAIQFLFMSGASVDAFKMAQANGKMDVYAQVKGARVAAHFSSSNLTFSCAYRSPLYWYSTVQVLGDDARVADYEMVASHYENADDVINAGSFYIKCRKYAQAVSLLLRDSGLPNDAGHIDLAIEAAGKANDDALTQSLIEYLLAGSMDASYLFKLYMALKRYVVYPRSV
jgi:hypothetical protein